MPVTLLSFDPLRIQLAMLAAGLSAFGAVVRMSIAGWFSSQFGFRSMLGTWRFDIVLPIWVAAALFIFYRLWELGKGDRAALRTTAEGLEVRTFLKHRIVPWNALLNSQAITNWYGPHRHRSFNIRYQEEGATRSLRVPLFLAGRPTGGISELPDRIEKAQGAVLGRTPGAGGAFDPDAAIRRYLETKATTSDAASAAAARAGPSAPPARAASFGRRVTPPR